MKTRKYFNRNDKSENFFQPGARGAESEQYKRPRGRDEVDDYYSPIIETSLIKYVPSSAATRPACYIDEQNQWGRRVERDRSSANQVYEVCGSTVEGEQLLVDIDSGANQIIIQRVHLFEQLDRGRKSALRTANGQASLQVEGVGEVGK